MRGMMHFWKNPFTENIKISVESVNGFQSALRKCFKN